MPTGKSVKLVLDVRAFIPTLPGSATLGTIGRWFQAGDTLQLGDPVTKTYDHRDHTVRPVLNFQEGCFVLEEELVDGTRFPAPPNPYLTVKPV